jgi:hypothetical protein
LETWPPDVRAGSRADREWLAEHTRRLRSGWSSNGMHNGVAVVILHYALK